MVNSKSHHGNGRRLALLAVIIVLITVVTGACTRAPETKVNSSLGGIQTVSFNNARNFQNDIAYWNSHDCQSQWISLAYTNDTCEAIGMNFDFCWANRSDTSLYCQEFSK